MKARYYLLFVAISLAAGEVEQWVYPIGPQGMIAGLTSVLVLWVLLLRYEVR